MSPGWKRKAAAMPARQLHLIVAVLFLAVTAALWFYGLRAPLAGLRAVRAEQALLVSGGADPKLLAAQLALLGTEARALEQRVSAGAAQPSAQLLIGLMSELGALARDQGVQLHGITPAPEEATLVFSKIGFNAGATGSYAGLLAWMSSIERARPNLSVVSFDMRPARTPGQVDMTIHIAAYRPRESKP